MQTVRDLINLWPTRRALADDIGTKPNIVQKWSDHNRIPSDWQAKVLAAAKRRRFRGATAAWMVAAHDREHTSKEKL